MEESMKMEYKKGYKYQLTVTMIFKLDFGPDESIFHEENTLNPFIDFEKDGYLTVHAGYAWNGASGPAIDTKAFRVSSLAHDSLYQLIQLGLISIELRVKNDNAMRRINREWGMSWFRAWYTWLGVRLFGGWAATAAYQVYTIMKPTKGVK